MEEGKVCDHDQILNSFNGKLAVGVFGPIFSRLPFSPNQITVFNFFTNDLLSVYFFSRGTHKDNLIGLFFCGLSAIADKLDGFIARKRGLTSELGGWLDAILDSVWQNMLVGAIVFGVFTSKGNSPLWLAIGLFASVSLVISNRLRSLYRDKFDLGFHSNVYDFRERISSDEDTTTLGKLFLQIIAPTNFFFLFLFTIRYFIVLGVLTNRMDVTLMMIAASCFFRAIVLFSVYVLFLADEKEESRRPTIKILHSRRRQFQWPQK